MINSVLTPARALFAPKFKKLQKRNPQLYSVPALASLANTSISLSVGEAGLLFN